MEDVQSEPNVKTEEPTANTNGGKPKDEEEKSNDEGGDHFEMELGAEIRFKVKSIHFTQVTNTAKGVQATTTMTAHSQELPSSSTSGQAATDENDSVKRSSSSSPEIPLPRSLRKRTMSVDISDMSNLPASMNIVASICEDGLGLTSWWASGDDDDDEVGEEEE